jgi:hypothetical protein
MGCGTGILLTQDTFRITLQFDPNIPQENPIYTNFESAMRGFLGDRLDCDNPWTVHLLDDKVNTIDILMHGPIQTVEQQQQFNRIMNRLLWGVRMICGNAAGGGAPAPSGVEVNVIELQKNDEEPTLADWTFEETCGISPISLKTARKKTPAKQEPAAKGKAASKRKTRAKR